MLAPLALPIQRSVGESQAPFEQITRVWLPHNKIVGNNISVLVLEQVAELKGAMSFQLHTHANWFTTT